LQNQAKSKGVNGDNIFKPLLVLGYEELKNISQLMHSGYGAELTYGKDVFFNF
jgi:hypothetical protein